MTRRVEFRETKEEVAMTMAVRLEPPVQDLKKGRLAERGSRREREGARQFGITPW
jgi:hypothetical protein